MNPGPLISTAELAARLGRPDLLVLDIRSAVDGGGRAAYEAAHIPGAVHADYVADGWRATRGAATGLLPEPDALAALFGGLGIRPDSDVVVTPAGVSSGDFAAAARVYWTLKVAGHARLSLLDGGVSAWTAEGRPVEAGPSRPVAAEPYPVRIAADLRAVLPQVERAVAEGSAALVDSRGLAFFAGEAKSPQAARAGRLPGAIWIDGAAAYDAAANRLKPRPELEKLFAIVPAGDAIPFCNTGQAAATDWFVLSEIMGRPRVALYDGSMSEWTEDPARPVETGAVRESGRLPSN